LNRYTVRPVESTRIDPRLPLATPTVAEAPVGVFGGDAAAAPTPPPQRSERQAVSPLR
jgi:hypothetical protein